MDRSNYCGCKGIRSCLMCEEKFNLKGNCALFANTAESSISYVYCLTCNKVYPGWNEITDKFHNSHSNITNDVKSYYIPGICIIQDFLSIEEEQNIIQYVDSVPWQLSQSGRRKQNYGPKCNFKKRKLKLGSFNGFPEQTKFIQEKFKQYSILDKYYTIEQCFMEYDPVRGSSIDPHIDDCWIWGERIITVSLLSDSVLTLTKYKEENSKYNLTNAQKIKYSNPKTDDFIIRIPMPQRSLIMLYDEARYAWEHSVLREDITKRRVCIAYREFTPPYLPNGLYEHVGEEILKKASQTLSR